MGWATAVSLMLFPNMFQEFGGGFMDALSASLLCLTMLVIVRRKWAWAVPLMAFQSVSYPMVALLSGMVLLVDAILHDGRRWFDARQWRRKYLFLAAAAGVAAGIIAWKYLGGHEFGELASRATMAARPEFGVESRSRVLPVDPLWTQFSGRLFDPFHLTLCLFAVAHLAKAAFRLPRGLASLLLASVVMYVLADIFVMRFYFPSRYVYFSLPLFAALTAGYWTSLLADKVRDARSRGAPSPFGRLSWITVAVVVVVGFVEFGASSARGLGTEEYRYYDLYAWISGLPVGQ